MKKKNDNNNHEIRILIIIILIIIIIRRNISLPIFCRMVHRCWSRLPAYFRLSSGCPQKMNSRHSQSHNVNNNNNNHNDGNEDDNDFREFPSGWLGAVLAKSLRRRSRMLFSNAVKTKSYELRLLWNA